MSRPLWFVQLLKKIFPTRYHLARWTRVPLFDRLVEACFFAGDRIFCLPQDQALRTIQIDQPVALPEEVVLPSQVVEYFIKQAKTHWLMNTCLCREANHCQSYPTELGCLFLGEAAAGINPRLGRPVTKIEALAHVRRCREAGLVHVIGRSRVDAFWLGVGPAEKLLTICNCCPCCCLISVSPHLAPRLGARITRLPGVSITVNERCLGCGTCAAGICVVDAISLLNGRAVIGDACRGCGRCVAVCPQQAIELAVEDDQFVTGAIARLSPLIEVI